MKRAEENVVDSQEKLKSIGRKRKLKDIAECSKVENYRKKNKLQGRLPFQRLRQGTLKNLMFLQRKGLPKEGRMRLKKLVVKFMVPQITIKVQPLMGCGAP